MIRSKCRFNPDRQHLINNDDENKNCLDICYWFYRIGCHLAVRDLYLKSGYTVDCGDGPHHRIDLRDFVNQYSAYSLNIEAELQGKGKLSAKLEPVLLQQLSDAVQQGKEFRTYVVAGFNACAITKAQYAEFGARFQALTGLARAIDRMSEKQRLTDSEKDQLRKTVIEFVEESQKFSK